MTFTESEEFTKIANEIRATSIVVDGETQLKLYALYKQTTVGDNNAVAPRAWTKETAKLKAWVEQNGKARESAQAEYIDLARLVLKG